MQIESLDAAMCVLPRWPGLYGWEVPDGWQQGRGAYGGLSFGALAAAMIQAEPDEDRPLRAFTAELPGPALVGATDIQVTELRRGTGMSTWEATARQVSGICGRATGIFGRTRPDTHPWAPERPVAPPWTALEPVYIGPPIAPTFARFFEYRPVAGFPFSGGAAPETITWVGPKVRVARIGAVELLAWVDAVWPSSFVVERAPRPIATVSFQAQLFPVTLDPAEPLLYRARTVASQAGFMLELRELWSPAGELVVLNQQTIVNIR